jgi:hypothetical protein
VFSVSSESSPRPADKEGSLGAFFREATHPDGSSGKKNKLRSHDEGEKGMLQGRLLKLNAIHITIHLMSFLNSPGQQEVRLQTSYIH